MRSLLNIVIFVVLVCVLFACYDNPQEKELMSNLDHVYFVWYSQKQREVLDHLYEGYNFAILEDSTIVEYTELTIKKSPSGVWDDYEYLGRGKWYKVLK